MLYPEQHFATNEILVVITVFIARLDIKPMVGEWKLPTTANTNVAAVTTEPDNDVQVEIKAREGVQGCQMGGQA